ncbi:hypothetical protein GGI1_07227, partial [Acidithiobacillus sp. GGI-221]
GKSLHGQPIKIDAGVKVMADKRVINGSNLLDHIFLVHNIENRKEGIAIGHVQQSSNVQIGIV